MKFIPSGGRVTVKLDAVDEKKVGSILIPGMHSELSRTGTVLAVGGEAKMYKVGERVFMGYHAGNVIDTMESKADTFRVMDEAEIWGWVTEE
jgi:co-chaperonin GroES (HSP10)